MRAKSTMLRMRGISLIEMMVTVSIVAVLITVSAPSFSRMLSTTRVASTAHELANSLHLARAEAVRRGLPTTLRSSSDSNKYSAGWKIFPDANADGAAESSTNRIDGALVVESVPQTSLLIERVSRSGTPTSPYVRDAATTAKYMIFNSRGAHLNGPSYFRVCGQTSVAEKGRIVEITVTGRITVLTAEVSC